jgi:hypothetical protein
MRLLKPTRLAIFGIGFLAGSRAGRKPWDTFQGKVSELQHRAAGSGANGSIYTDGARSMDRPSPAAAKDGTLTEF